MIRISETLKERLAAQGRFGESYEDVISRILDENEELKNLENRKKENPLEGVLIPALA